MKRGAHSAIADRLGFIEGMRGLAALYVVIGHFCTMVDPKGFAGKPSDAHPITQALMAPFMYGHLAVAAFIVISGFCLQMALFHNGSGRILDLKKFIVRRSMRILPPYYACLALSVLAALYITPLGRGMPFDQYLPVTPENVAAHALMIHNLSPEWMYKLNGVLWSIAIEAQLYILFPLLVLVLARAGRMALTVLGVGASVAVLASMPESVKLYPWYLALFVIGMVAASLAFRPHLRLGPAPVLGLITAALGLGFTAWAASTKTIMPVRDTGIGLMAAALMYVGAVAPSSFATRALSWKPLVGLGTMSYSLYLMHHPIQQAIYLFRPIGVVGVEVELLYLLGVGLPVILLGCALFWWIAERPFLYSRRYEEAAIHSRVPVSLPLATVHRSASVVDLSPKASSGQPVVAAAPQPLSLL